MAELETIPAFDSACTAGCTVTTCSCTHGVDYSAEYWSATTGSSCSCGAWALDFNLGAVFEYVKSSDVYVRAVRGGW